MKEKVDVDASEMLRLWKKEQWFACLYHLQCEVTAYSKKAVEDSAEELCERKEEEKETHHMLKTVWKNCLQKDLSSEMKEVALSLASLLCEGLHRCLIARFYLSLLL